MKYVRKAIMCLLISSLLLGVFSIHSFAAKPTDAMVNMVTVEDVIAGLASPSHLSLSATRGMSANAPISDGTYYLNGEYSGHYLKHNPSSPSAEPGTFSALGASIKWKITNVNGSFTIQPLNNPTKYLSVSSTGNAIQYVTVSGTTVPEACLWDIAFAANGGCLIQNVSNSRYLCSYGSTVSTVDSPGSSASATYTTCVWRVAAISLVSDRELDASSNFSTLTLSVGNSGSPSMTMLPTNAVWAFPSDFTYSIQPTTRVTESNGVFTANASGVTTVIATHKVTEFQFIFAVVVGALPTYTVNNYYDQGHIARFGGYSNIQAFNAVVQAKFAQIFGLNITSTFTLYTSTPDTCRIEQFGEVTASTVSMPCPHTICHLTTANMMDDMSNGTPTAAVVVWSGHLMQHHPNDWANANLARHIVAIPFPGETGEDPSSTYMFQLMHEISHLFDLPDHYCYGRNNDQPCINEDCFDCYLYNNDDDKPSCIMYEDYEYFEDAAEETLYCSSCLATISDHLSDHHQ